MSGSRLVTEGTVDVTPGTELVEGPLDEGPFVVVVDEDSSGVVPLSDVVVWRGPNVTIVLPIVVDEDWLVAWVVVDDNVVVGDELVLDASDVDEELFGSVDVDDDCVGGCVVDEDVVVEDDVDVDVVSS